METQTIKQDKVYEEITAKIIGFLEKGDLAWLKGWNCGLPQNFVTKKNYRGINAILTRIHQVENGFSQPYYLTFLQIKKLKGRVKAGEKGEMVVYYNFNNSVNVNVCKKCGFIPDDCKCEGKIETEEKHFKLPLLKTYYVFNIEQTDLKIEKKEEKEFNPIQECEKVVEGYKGRPEIIEDLTKAYYNPVDDVIGIPSKKLFNSEQEYYSTLFHELTHSTGHEKRLKREGIIKMNFFGDNTYSKEEVVAELGNAFLCAKTGIDNKTLKNSSAYIQSWLKNLKEDKKFIFKVTSQAQKGVDFILGENK